MDDQTGDRAALARSLLWVRAVRSRLADGWHPVVTTKGTRWRRINAAGTRMEEKRFTPAHGNALDAMAVIEADTGTGLLHRHSVNGTAYDHRHPRGYVPHAHRLADLPEPPP